MDSSTARTLLGVGTDATEDEIRDAFHEQIKQSHPDKSDAENATERSRQIINARDRLLKEINSEDTAGSTTKTGKRSTNKQPENTTTGGANTRTSSQDDDSSKRKRTRTTGGRQSTTSTKRETQKHRGGDWRNQTDGYRQATSTADSTGQSQTTKQQTTPNQKTETGTGNTTVNDTADSNRTSKPPSDPWEFYALMLGLSVTYILGAIHYLAEVLDTVGALSYLYLVDGGAGWGCLVVGCAGLGWMFHRRPAGAIWVIYPVAMIVPAAIVDAIVVALKFILPASTVDSIGAVLIVLAAFFPAINGFRLVYRYLKSLRE